MAVRVEERAELRKHLISLEEYERMIEADVFETEARLELIRGEIVEMTPPGPAHEVMVARLHRLFAKLVGDAGLIWPQGNSIRLPQSKSRPQPDLTILRWRDDLYADKRPYPEDVILLVEVSDSTLAFDRRGKMALYAEAAIPEYWVINIVDKSVEVYAQPTAGKYQVVRALRRGEIIPLSHPLEGDIAVDDILR